MSLTLSARIAELEEYGDAASLGALAFLTGKPQRDNPFWEGGVPYDHQSPKAIDWEDGWCAEQDAATRISTPSQTREAA